MTAHIVYTAWDAENPATQSPFVINEIIRKRIGFGGLLLSDDLDMEALSGTIPERAERAVAAGCDVALNCWARMDDMVGIATRLPTITEEGAVRLARAMASAADTVRDGDHATLLARRDTLLALAEARA
jgi:beta-N-acetylhexosaminidase